MREVITHNNGQWFMLMGLPEGPLSGGQAVGFIAIGCAPVLAPDEALTLVRDQLKINESDATYHGPRVVLLRLPEVSHA